MDVQEYPRIGNRSDALDLLDRLLEEVDPDDTFKGLYLVQALEALRDAIEREIL